jgi:hypothetical protein
MVIQYLHCKIRGKIITLKLINSFVICKFLDCLVDVQCSFSDPHWFFADLDPTKNLNGRIRIWIRIQIIEKIYGSLRNTEPGLLPVLSVLHIFSKLCQIFLSASVFVMICLKKSLGFRFRNKCACSWIQIQEANHLRIRGCPSGDGEVGFADLRVSLQLKRANRKFPG